MVSVFFLDMNYGSGTCQNGTYSKFFVSLGRVHWRETQDREGGEEARAGAAAEEGEAKEEEREDKADQRGGRNQEKSKSLGGQLFQVGNS